MRGTPSSNPGHGTRADVLNHDEKKPCQSCRSTRRSSKSAPPRSYSLTCATRAASPSSGSSPACGRVRLAACAAQPAGSLLACCQHADRRVDPQLRDSGVRRRRTRPSAGQATAGDQGWPSAAADGTWDGNHDRRGQAQGAGAWAETLPASLRSARRIGRRLVGRHWIVSFDQARAPAGGCSTRPRQRTLDSRRRRP
jgi:hypothetical protein